MTRTYSELITLPTFEERFKYLQLSGKVGRETFGFDRYLNQVFYRSKEWKSVRDYVIAAKDITDRADILLNPEYLITTCHNTHNAIHYGDESLLITMPTERRPNDTCLWKK